MAKPFNELEQIIEKADHSLPNQDFYRNVEQALMIRLDEHDGIKTEFKDITINYPHGGKDGAPTQATLPAYVRDATSAIPLEQRISQEHPIVEADHILLRSLSTLRGIDHVLEKQAKAFPENAAAYAEQREELKIAYMALQDKVAQLDLKNMPEAEAKKQLAQLHKDFNTTLIQSLHRLHLDEGIKQTPKGYEELLLHFRYMAKLIDPTPAMQTITQDKEHGAKITETSIPITKKTDAQKKSLEVMREVNTAPVGKQINYQTSKPKALQVINAAFADEVAMDDRQLTSKKRNYIKDTVGNGRLVHLEVDHENLVGKPKDEMWTLRSGTMAYTGKGESEESIQAAANENVKQLQMYAEMAKGPEVKVHYTIVNTNSRLEQQNVMLKHTEEAMTQLEGHYSKIPINFEGRFIDSTDINEDVLAAAKEFGKRVSKENISDAWRPDISADRRAQRAGQIAYAANEMENTINQVSCAHGRDRTGTIVLLLELNFLAEKYMQRYNLTFDQAWEKVAALQTAGTNAAALNNLDTPGSSGMNGDSRPGDLFGKDANKALYRKSAYTVTKLPIDENAIKHLDDVEKYDETKDKHYEPEKSQERLEEVVEDLQAHLQSICEKLDAKSEELLKIDDSIKETDEENEEDEEKMPEFTDPRLNLVMDMSLKFSDLLDEINATFGEPGDHSLSSYDEKTVKDFVGKFVDIAHKSEQKLNEPYSNIDRGFKQKFTDFLKTSAMSLLNKVGIKLDNPFTLSTAAHVGFVRESAKFFAGFGKNAFEKTKAIDTDVTEETKKTEDKKEVEKDHDESGEDITSDDDSKNDNEEDGNDSYHINLK